MSGEDDGEIGVNVYDEDELIEDEEAAPQPVEVVREEMVTVTKNADSEVDLHEVVKAHSDEISRLTEIVESLQSQIKEIDQRPASGNNKTSSVGRKRSATKTKKNKAISKRAKRKSSNRK